MSSSCVSIVSSVCVCVYVWGSVLYRTIFSRCLHVVTPGQKFTGFLKIVFMNCWLKPAAGLDNVYLGTGRHSMASLTACHTCSPAEDLQLSQASSHHAHRARKRKPSSWLLGSWNVHSMVDTEGPVEIASNRGDRGEDRKVDLIVQEMRRCNVKVTTLQETKWFGSEVYRVAGSVVLTSGREKPVQGDTVKKGEGVAIAVTDWTINAWKAAGRQWKAWISRAVSACLQLGGRSRCLAMLQLEMLAGMRRIHFFDELNSILPSVPAGEQYIVLDDFNARVGSRQVVGDQWSKVRGLHGCGVINDAGKELLGFLSTQQATVCNTWDWKKEIHRVTGKQPKSKQWSCIDYVIMRECDRRICSDVTGKRGAECNTDHQFLHASVKWHGGVSRREQNE